MRVAITGATGFVGNRLVAKLHEQGAEIVVLTRNPQKAQQIFSPLTYPRVNVVTYQPETYAGEGLNGCDAVVNLAGQPIAERWTPEYKRGILQSRQTVTHNLVQAIAQIETRPQVLVNASAIGYYGTSETATFDESSAAGDDFLAQVCQTWEAEAKKVQEAGVRLVILRIGIVLDIGGALGKMINPFKMFAGGPIGSGKQWFSWIHRDDLVDLIITSIQKPEMQGVYNATAPQPVRMNEFCDTLGKVMGRPSWLPVPALAIELLLGEGAMVVLDGQKVMPKETQTFFNYQYPQLREALEEIVLKI